jgi:Secretion system C-terminal sorting domain/Fascin domain/Glycosyl hydrolase family 26
MKKILLLMLLLSFATSFSQKFTPPNGQRLMFVGQDINSVNGYKNSGAFQTPAGVTTYINDSNTALRSTTDWGAGPLNAVQTAAENPNSTISIGYYMVNQTDAIAAGQRDNQIRDIANYISQVNRPVFLRIGYEFDGAWNAYNQTSYINAYRRVVDIIRQNANAAKWMVSVWQSCTSPIDDNIDGGRENLGAYYPGDSYVDWVGMSWFLLPNETSTTGGTISTQIVLANELVSFAKTHNKPVMIAEAAPQGYQLDTNTNCNIGGWDGTAAQNCLNKTPTQIWSEWFAPFFNFIYANPEIRAVAYINANWDAQSLWASPYSQGYWGDTRIETNTTIRNNWRAELNKATWLHGSSTLFNTLSGGGGGGGTTSPIGKAIYLQNGGKYVSSENGAESGMKCNRPTVGAWERFTVVAQANGKVALKGTNGRYVSSENGTQAMRCDRTTVGTQELFDLINVTETSFQLRGNNGRFVSSENGGAPMTCNRTTAGVWEKFNWAQNGAAFRLATSEKIVVENTDSVFSFYPNPNPTGSSITVELPKQTTAINILDISGKLVKAIKTNGETKVQVNLLTIPAGVYFINVDDSNAKKLIVE